MAARLIRGSPAAWKWLWLADEAGTADLDNITETLADATRACEDQTYGVNDRGDWIWQAERGIPMGADVIPVEVEVRRPTGWMR